MVLCCRGILDGAYREDEDESCFNPRSNPPPISKAVPSKAVSGPFMNPCKALVPASLASDDESTMAPSDGGEHWEEASQDDRIVRELPLAEASNSRSNSVQCNLCSMLDCLRAQKFGGQSQIVQGSENSLPQEKIAPPQRKASAKASASAERWRRKKNNRRYRPPFPGIPIDPELVGLGHLQKANEREFQRILESRTQKPVVNPLT
eukprot:TRINITY_DN31933_c0_g1_i1.p1 TRINITY_DN31933_c0_g1~~TRINITY_DN31933_c0_g1_i1.p1  ORF type:complete len:206 (+),score=23.23 TRINITY_DN31933_c0_g1_i1:107-724(+)